MKLVLDTNIFISAFYWDGNSQQVINRIIEGVDELYITNEIINEIADVMGRPKFKTKPEIIERYIRTIEKIGKKVFITGMIKGICRDKDDDVIIECGLLSSADYLITGDSDLLVIHEYQQMKIIEVKRFFEIISGQTMKSGDYVT
jgi:putative PIN family toxin of toxin-antitoxin system